MTEFALLAIFGRMLRWGRGPIVATRRVAADAEVLGCLLSDPDNQWQLLAGGRLGRRARIEIKPSRTTRLMTAELRFGPRTVAWITWILVPGRGTTGVDLAVALESRRLFARLALLLGGRRWIARRLESALATLATMSARVAEHGVALPASHAVPALDVTLERCTGEPRHAPSG